MFVCQDQTYAQIAEAWMHYFVKDAISATSSGLSAGHISPNFVSVMSEVGIDVSKNASKLLSDYHPKNFDAVISLGNSSTRLPEDWMLRQVFDEWILSQPEVESPESCRQVRDDIKDRIDVLLMRYST